MRVLGLDLFDVEITTDTDTDDGNPSADLSGGTSSFLPHRLHALAR